jgi:hypothetical protein
MKPYGGKRELVLTRLTPHGFDMKTQNHVHVVACGPDLLALYDLLTVWRSSRDGVLNPKASDGGFSSEYDWP